jgi:hypothetical protein
LTFFLLLVRLISLILFYGRLKPTLHFYFCYVVNSNHYCNYLFFGYNPFINKYEEYRLVNTTIK